MKNHSSLALSLTVLILAGFALAFVATSSVTISKRAQISVAPQSQTAAVLNTMTLVRDPSSPPAVKSNSSALTTQTFTPPAGSTLYVLVAMNSNAYGGQQNRITSITDSLPSHLAYTKQASYGTEGGDSALVYLYTAPVASSQPMTVTVNQSSSQASSRNALLKVIVMNKADQNKPVGFVSGGFSSSASGATATYKTTRDKTWGWMIYGDWAQKGIPSMNSILALNESFDIPNEDSYAFISTPGVETFANADVRMNVSSPSAGAHVSYLVFEMLPAVQTSDPVPNSPIISNITARKISSTEAVITWTTDQPANTQIEYGLTPSYGSKTALNPDLNTAHSLAVSGLSPNTSYNYRVLSANSAGIKAVSSNQSFTTIRSFLLNVIKIGTALGTVTGPGINCGSICNALVDEGKTVTLSASSMPGGTGYTTFTGWSGACGGNANCVITITGSTTVNANFVPPPIQYTVNVTKQGSGSGLVSGGPINCGNTCTFGGLSPDTTFTLTASPSAGSVFAGWGDGCAKAGNSPSCYLDLKVDRPSITARFESAASVLLPPSNLKANAVSSSEIDLSWDPSTSAGVIGYKVYRNNEFIANVTGSNSFKNVSGLSPDTNYSYTVASYSSSQVSAKTPALQARTLKFALGSHAKLTTGVTVRNSPSTSGTRVGDQPAGATGVVTGNATFAGGYYWWNVNFDNSSIDGYVMDNYLAAYTPVSHTLSLVVSSHGKVSSSAGGISNCTNTTCTASLSEGQAVTLTAVPDAGYSTAWGGCTVSSSDPNSCGLTVSANSSVSATFNSLGTTANVGHAIIGANLDSGDSNYMNATKVTMPAENGILSSMSVYVGSVSASPNNQYQMAVYSDNGGAPGNLVASTAVGNLTANSWNTLPISGNLTSGSSYWLAYNTNGSSVSSNNMRYDSGGVTVWRAQTFGSYPASYGSVADSSATQMSLYATYQVRPPQKFTLTVNKTGTGTVTSDPSGITCGATCTATFNENTSVKLTAQPGAQQYVSWSNGCTGTASTCTVAMTGNLSIGATFVTDTVAPTVPGTPAALSLQSNAVTLTWTASTDSGSGVAGYNIYRGGALIGTASTNQYTDTTVSPLSSYSYTVSAFDKTAPPNTSAQSSALLVTTPKAETGIFMPADRLIDWAQSGVEGGIPKRTKICSTFSSGASADTISSAIATCAANGGGVVYLNEGTYNLSSGITFALNDNVTLRGAGPDKTILRFSSNVNCGLNGTICIGGNVNNGLQEAPNGAPNVRNWLGVNGSTGTYQKDSTVLTLNSVDGLEPGMYIGLDQLDDNIDVGHTATMSTGGCAACGRMNNRGQSQMVKVTGKNTANNTITISPGVFMTTYRTSQSPQVYWYGDGAVNDGVEDLALYNNGIENAIAIVNAHNIWLKNVKSVDADQSHVWTYIASHIEIRDCYFYMSRGDSIGAFSYGFQLWATSNDLLVNNIFERIVGGVVPAGSSGGYAVAYNFLTNMQGLNYTKDWDLGMGLTSHDTHSHMVLYEGNDANAVKADNVHGSGSNLVAFRNRLTGTMPGKPGVSSPVWLEPYNRKASVVGNILGSTVHDCYQKDPNNRCGDAIYKLVYDNNDAIGNDMQVITSMLRWGNFDYVNNAVRWNTAELNGLVANPSQNMKASLIYNSAPTWWATKFGTPQWPPFGPDPANPSVLHNDTIPAKLCYEHSALLADGTRNYNANNCYTDTYGTK